MYVAYVVYTLFGAGPLLGAPLAMLVPGDARGHRLFRTDPRNHEGADAGPDLRHSSGSRCCCAIPRSGWFGAPNFTHPAGRYLVGGTFDVYGLRIQALAAAGRRGGAMLVTLGLHPLAHAHLARIEKCAGEVGGRFHRRATDGNPARHHAGHRLGDRRGRHWSRRRADCHVLLYRADRRRDARDQSHSSRCRWGGFGSVPGALVAGLLKSGSSSPRRRTGCGAVYKEHGGSIRCSSASSGSGPRA